MTKHFLASVTLALALGGCAALQPEEKMAPRPQAPAVELTKEQGGRFIAFVGQKQQHAAKFLDVDDTNYFCLRSWLDNKTGETAHQLYIEDSYYGGPYMWNGVYDTADTKLKLIPISRNQISCDQGCSFADEFAAELPEDYLRAHQDGFAVTFTSTNGKTLEIKVPADMVTAELTAVDAVKDIAAKAKANPPAPPDAKATPTTPPAATASSTPAASSPPAEPSTPPAAAATPTPPEPPPPLPAGTVVPAPPKS